MAERFLHPAVERELARPSSEGDRHNQILRVLPSLRGDGWSGDKLFELIRSRYSADFPDAEIRALIDWAQSRDFQPSRGNNGANCQYKLDPELRKSMPLTPEQRAQREKEKITTWIRNAEGFLVGERVDEHELWEHSPIRPSDNIAQDAELMFRYLYDQGELINVCWDYTLRDQKAQPCGAGVTMTALP
jgi:hypothetical protein